MAPGRTLLIVDGDEVLRRALRDQLVIAEPEAVIEEAGMAAACMAKAAVVAYDLFLIDARLPDGDGWKVCGDLREAGVRAPIIMMTSATDVDSESGFESGASDYIAKPFRMASLLARVHALLHNQEQSDAAAVVIGPYKFQPAAKTLTIDGRKIRLTEKETAILRYLYRIGNKIVSRETLLGEVWGYNAAVTTHTLETHVYRLRQKMEVDPQQAQLLVTEPGGYRLNP